ncbi:uncharacterized protein VTP21DRAFT_7193 [Calcarisporiella thermophila]|uniref:uncharacterized protein n=1 Tax=Calcarisporiella thermophila TaxID=911321 RepID=UPI003742B49E
MEQQSDKSTTPPESRQEASKQSPTPSSNNSRSATNDLKSNGHLRNDPAYRAAVAAGYNPNDPATFHIAYHCGFYPVQYYPGGNPPAGDQSPQFQPVGAAGAYYAPASPAFYPANPQSAPTAAAGVVMQSPPLHPTAYGYAYPSSIPSSPAFSQLSSPPGSPPLRYITSPMASPPGSPSWKPARSGSRPSSRQQDPFYNPTQTTNVYIRGLPPTTTDESLYNMCVVYGKITSSKAMLDQRTGECKGYGFVMYETDDEAKRAMEALMQMGFQVSFAKDSFSLRLKSLQDHTSTNIYLSNLPLDMDENALEEMLQPYRTTSSKIMRDPVTNASRGVGFARMVDRQSAEAIITKFNGTTLEGSNVPLQVRFADSPAQKKLKGQVVKKTVWRAAGMGMGVGGMGQPLTPETVLGIGNAPPVVATPSGYYAAYPPPAQSQNHPMNAQRYLPQVAATSYPVGYYYPPPAEGEERSSAEELTGLVQKMGIEEKETVA